MSDYPMITAFADPDTVASPIGTKKRNDTYSIVNADWIGIRDIKMSHALVNRQIKLEVEAKPWDRKMGFASSKT